jgi:thiamine kinase-like enzyme
VQGRLLWQVGEFDVWLETARWLARMHAQVGRPTPAIVEQARLLHYDAAFCGRWAERALQYASASAEASTVLRHIAARYSRVTDRLAALPASFLHGEFYASNVLVASNGDATGIFPVDWEMAGVGPGLLDLAALVSGHWDAHERRAFARAYFDELHGEASDVARFEKLHEGLEWCRLHVAIQWLGWSENWSPPKEHAHNWLRDIRELASTLDL